MKELSFVVAIRHPGWSRVDWRERFTAFLVPLGYRILPDPDGHGPSTISRRVLELELELGRCLFEDAPPDRPGAANSAFFARPACPYAGELLGWFKWEQHWFPEEEAAAELLATCCHAYASLFARRPEGWERPIAEMDDGCVEARFEGVPRQMFPLTDLLSKYGFGDGDALLDCGGSYRDDALAAAGAALEAAGVLPDIGEIATAHNPLRFTFYVKGRSGRMRALLRTLDGKRRSLESVEALLAGKSVELWAFAHPDEVKRWVFGALGIR